MEALKPREGGLRAGTEEVQRRDEAAGQADGPGGPGAGARAVGQRRVQADRPAAGNPAGHVARLVQAGRHRRRPGPGGEHRGVRGAQTTAAGERRAAAGQRDPQDRVGVFRCGGARPPYPLIVDYIDQHKHRFGVEPICAALQAEGIAVAPSGYYAAKKRLPSRRSLSDAVLAETIEATFSDRQKGRGVYGARKMWHQLRRDGVTGPGGRPVARCTVERLMRELGLRGARRGQPTITTRADRHSERAPDLVDRDFTAARPNQLWVVDLTYVPTWSGTVTPLGGGQPEPGLQVT